MKLYDFGLIVLLAMVLTVSVVTVTGNNKVKVDTKIEGIK